MNPLNPLKSLNTWMLKWQSSRELAADARVERRKRRRQTERAVMPWMIWFLLVAVAFVLVPEQGSLAWLRIVLILALVPPLLAMAWIRMREVLAGDELEQRIELLAMGVTFILALFALLFLSLLHMADISIRIRPLWAFYALFLGYHLILRLVRARYQ